MNWAKMINESSAIPASARLLPSEQGAGSDWKAVARFLASQSIDRDLHFKPQRFATGYLPKTAHVAD